MLLAKSIFGQEKKANIIGVIGIRTSEISQQFIFPDGATIRLISGKDTLYTVAYSYKFSFEKVPLGKAKITVSHLNFQTFDTIVNIVKTMPLIINLKQKVNTLNEITVKGNVPLIIRSGDTLKFNAAAVKLMEGDVALEILKKMPGVEISESGIKVYGKDIARTYVNDKMVFGKDDKTAALENIPAGEVVSINTYEEHKDPDAAYHSTKEEKVRVLNIKTKNPIFGASVIQALVSEGHDIDKNGKTRYAAGISANIYSEDLLVSVNALTSNNNRNSVRPEDFMYMRAPDSDVKKKSFDAKIDKTWGKFFYFDKFRVEGGVSYSKGDVRNVNLSQILYLPVPEYNRRESSDTSTNSSVNSSKNIYLTFNLTNKKFLNIIIKNSYSRNDNEINSLRSGMSVLNDNIIKYKSEYNGNGNDHKFTQNIFLNYRNKTTNFMLTSDFMEGNGNGSGFRIDSLASTGLKKVIETGPEGYNRSYDFNSNFMTFFEKRTFNNLIFGYQYHTEKSTSRKFVSDITDINNIFTDSVKSYNYTINHNYHLFKVGSGISLSKNTILNFGLNYKVVSLNRDEEFPLDKSYLRKQFALLPSITLEKKINQINFIQIYYLTNNIVPSTEQWRNYLNTQNPYQLTAGNQNLKQSYSQKIGFITFLNGTKNKTSYIVGSVEFVNNKIATKTTYFNENTTLTEWGNYLAQSQSTLSTFENLNGRIAANLNINLIKPIKSIKSTVNNIFSYSFEKDPSFIRDQLVTSRNHSLKYIYGIRGNFSKKLRINSNSSLRYINSQNSLGQKSNYVQAGEQIMLNILFLKNFYLNSMYDFSISERYSSQNSIVSQNILNAIAGIKFLKGSADLSIGVFDLLNSNKGFQTSMTNDYISNRWTYSYGRFFTINFAYKFYKSKKGLKMPSSMMDVDGGMLILR